MSNVKGFHRSITDNVLCSICRGIGTYLGVDMSTVCSPWILPGLLNPLVSATLYMVAHLMLLEEPKQRFCRAPTPH